MRLPDSLTLPMAEAGGFISSTHRKRHMHYVPVHGALRGSIIELTPPEEVRNSNRTQLAHQPHEISSGLSSHLLSSHLAGLCTLREIHQKCLGTLRVQSGAGSFPVFCLFGSFLVLVSGLSRLALKSPA